ncbi:MAG TPA: hypothetical protein VHW64_03520 [Nocardioides sp.]|uniref:hypothetical protein n=1 Tax=Nocardioides sp. TaxID=35761 RepID=UPI002E35F25C|nr:hypothetical protein [Nocardioides sp.]HEX3929747.1 hypothetical protein [Nocardioides sp.]
MLLRAVRARLLPSLATLALALVVSGGSVAVVGASRAGHTPGAVAAMLALYGAVALAEQAARSVVERSKDVALARLRGLHGLRLVLFAAGPLLAVTLVGIAVGSVAGTWLARRIVHGWSLTYALGAREVVVAVAILLGAWATVMLVSAAVIRRPLVDALSVNPRRRGSSWFTTFLELLVVVGACLAVYEAHHSERDWVPTIAPAVVALAAGQIVMWLLLLTPRVGQRLGAALTSRRLRRDPDPGSVLRVVVAAAVLLAVTLTGSRAAAEWRNDAARLRAGGPLVVPFSAGGLRAYAAEHDADPQGHWLMAAVAVNDLEPARRRLFVDTHRWDAVVGGYVAGTSAGSATGEMATLGRSPGPPLMRATSLRVDVTTVAGQLGVVTLRYLSDQGFLRTAKVRVDHTGTLSGDLPACAVGCTPVRLILGGSGFGIGSVSAGSVRLTGSTTYDGGRPQTVLQVDQGLSEIPVLTTPGLRLSTEIDALDGTSRAVQVVGQVRGVPFLGRAGSLLDLGQVLKGTVGTVAGARAVVVARADTPASVLAQLKQDGGGPTSRYGAVATRLDQTPQARADRLALLVALGVALVALTHLVAWLLGQADRRRAEVAGLRSAGIRPGSVRRAYLVESATLAVVVLLAAAIAAVATTVPLLRPMGLVGGWADAPAVRLGIRPVTLILVVLGVALVTAGLCAVTFTRFGRLARPSALRAADR